MTQNTANEQGEVEGDQPQRPWPRRAFFIVILGRERGTKGRAFRIEEGYVPFMPRSTLQKAHLKDYPVCP